nr:neurogenic locus notch homolog protein 3-like [Parasteatoda tepidariorum]
MNVAANLRESIRNKNWSETDLKAVPDRPRRDAVATFKSPSGSSHDCLGEHLHRIGETNLHVAARHDRADEAESLLRNVADVNAPDGTGRAPIHTAIGADALNVFMILMKHKNIDINSKSIDGSTPLILACRYELEDIGPILVEAGCDINASDSYEITKIYESVDTVISDYPQDQLSYPEEFLNTITPTGMPPHKLKIKKGAIIMLLRNLMPSKELCNGTRLIVTNLQRNLIEAKLIDDDEAGKTALHWAVAVNNMSAINLLLSHKANPNLQDGEGETPLFAAAREGCLEAAIRLLESGADRRIKNYLDKLPIDIARERSHIDLVEMFEEFLEPENV